MGSRSAPTAPLSAHLRAPSAGRGTRRPRSFATPPPGVAGSSSRRRRRCRGSRVAGGLRPTRESPTRRPTSARGGASRVRRVARAGVAMVACVSRRPVSTRAPASSARKTPREDAYGVVVERERGLVPRPLHLADRGVHLPDVGDAEREREPRVVAERRACKHAADLSAEPPLRRAASPPVPGLCAVVGDELFDARRTAVDRVPVAVAVDVRHVVVGRVGVVVDHLVRDGPRPCPVVRTAATIPPRISISLLGSSAFMSCSIVGAFVLPVSSTSSAASGQPALPGGERGTEAREQGGRSASRIGRGAVRRGVFPVRVVRNR